MGHNWVENIAWMRDGMVQTTANKKKKVMVAGENSGRLCMIKGQNLSSRVVVKNLTKNYAFRVMYKYVCICTEGRYATLIMLT